MKKILYVAVVYNTVSETRDMCLSLQSQTAGSYDLACVLVDNSDKSDSIAGVSALAIEFDFVTILRSGENPGYFPAITHALQTHADGYDFVVAGNNDLVYEEDFSNLLCDAAYDGDVMVVCPDIVTSDGVHQNPHHKGRLSFLQKRYFELYFSQYHIGLATEKTKSILLGLMGRKKYFSTHNTAQTQAGIIDQGVGACYVFLPNFLQKSKNTLFYRGFLYGEEACLSWQVRNLGGTFWYDPCLKIQHAESATLSHVPQRKTYEFARTSFWQYRNLL